MPVVDLFCGCGGLSKGFELAGFNVVAAYDEWQSALTCYNANFNHNAQSLDLGNVENAVNNMKNQVLSMRISPLSRLKGPLSSYKKVSSGYKKMNKKLLP